MSAAGGSAARQAAALRAGARQGLWRRLTAAVGLNPSARRADARAALWAHGAAGEEATAGMLARLEPYGWQVRHDLRLPGRRFNLDHVLVAPEGTVVVLDTKNWHRGRGRDTVLLRGRVHCGAEDRHEQIQKVATYAALVREALGMPGLVVWPLLVVHGSPVAGGVLTARAPGWDGPVYVLSPPYLVPTLVSAPRVRDPERAAAVAARVDQVLVPYR